MKLTKQQIKLHEQAHAIAKCGRALSEDEKYFVMENWREDAAHVNSKFGAFFTPCGLARDFSIEVTHGTIIDLCAGIGKLAFWSKSKASHIVCVEINPDYAEIGKAILPEAEWIVGDVFSLPESKIYDCAISNPPFGNIKTGEFKGSYTGSDFEYKVIEKASRIAKNGVFLIPQMSSSFRYSGGRHYEKNIPEKLAKFTKKTGIELGANCGIDTNQYISDWHGVSPVCEIVTCEFAPEKHQKNKNQTSLFEECFA